MKRPINMTTKELQALSQTVDTLLKKRRTTEVSQTREDCIRLIHSRGLTVDQVFVNSGGGVGKTFKVRHSQFVDPLNPQNVWSGRGRRPGWFMRQLKEGKKPEDMRRK